MHALIPEDETPQSVHRLTSKRGIETFFGVEGPRLRDVGLEEFEAGCTCSARVWRLVLRVVMDFGLPVGVDWHSELPTPCKPSSRQSQMPNPKSI